MSAPLLLIDDLHVDLEIDGATRTIVDGVSLEIGRGETLGLVGESGSGKSVTARSVLRLFPPDADVSGRIDVDGQSVLDMSPRDLRQLRSRKVAMIFQDPRAHINPVHRIGDFMTEAAIANLGLSPRDAAAKAVGLLEEVGIPDAARRMDQYPHELSGGLLQRVMIATVLAVDPELILADEPTTALDVTTQEEVMAILGELQRDRGLSMLFITHDLELAAATSDRTAVMYAGRIVEVQDSKQLQAAPRHPYTAGLLASRPSLDLVADQLPVIPGRPIAAFEAGSGCPFRDRCAYATDLCADHQPARVDIHGSNVACLRVEELAGVLSSTKEVPVHD